MTGPQIQVIGVAEDDPKAQIGQFFLGHGFDGAEGADRHEHGGLDLNMGQSQNAAPRPGIRGAVGEGERLT